MTKRRSTNQEETVFEINNGNQGQFAQPKPQSNIKSKPKKRIGNVGSEPETKDPLGLRIIGGRFRGSKLQYIGDNRVRPMKDRVREAVFNLIGPAVKDKHIIDLFGGTGALAIEALSRGAVSATVIEIHLPTAAMLRQNFESLKLLEVCNLRKTDSFFWAKNKEEHPKDQTPWIVFCSPPYDFYVTREAEMLEMFNNLLESAPVGSQFVIESDERFDFNLLPVEPLPNKVRLYPPAKIAIFSKER